MDWVLDASIALAWGLPEEASPQADRFLSRVSGKDVLWVPSLWWYELANALTLAERRKRLTEADGIQLRELYGMLPIKTDTIIGPEIIERLRTLAREYSLSAYDATYLELALRKGIRLATLDQNLQSATQKAGLATL
jgi:predicted nucleic acid-binding protein